MATTKLYLDTRASAQNAPAPIKIVLSSHGKTTTHSTGVKIMREQWDKQNCKVINHKDKQYLNTFLTSRLNEWDKAILKLVDTGNGKKAKSITDLKKLILHTIDPEEHTIVDENLFYARFVKFKDSRTAKGTQEVYERTMTKIEQYDCSIMKRTFEDINKDWLRGFEQFLEQTNKSANSRSIHFRNIRAVFNDAIDDEITSAYPFRKFKIKTQPTAKRSLTMEQLRTLMDYPVEDYQKKYRDMFILMLYLCGVNAVDLLNAKPGAIHNGRLEYIRAKTHKPYSVKVEPEAMEIIERYKGKKYLLNVMDTYSNYSDFLRRMDKELKRIGPVERIGRGGKKHITPLFPKLSQYWCRHTWATLAAELDIPKETIAAGLGHGGNTVTDIYINFDVKKVDAANRKVIDFILYDKG